VLLGADRDCGDEDFAEFGCPFCHHVYLNEIEDNSVSKQNDEVVMGAEKTNK
jgi:hypothetical protein